jgi:hypothetical protein
MMAHLLPIKKSAVDYALVGLTQNRVERLVAANIAGRAGERKPNYLFEPCERVHLREVLKHQRSKSKRAKEKREIGFRVEDLHGERNIEHFSSRQQSLDHILNHTTLF